MAQRQFLVLASRFLPTLNWLVENDRLDAARHTTIVEDLNALSTLSFTKKESRHLLWKLITKIVDNFFGSIGRAFTWVRTTIGKLFG